MTAINAEKHLAEAIDSVLKQSFRDFELILVNNGLTDESKTIIRSFNDKRIVVLKKEMHLATALNKGLKSAKGKYIARMDASETMHLERLRVQHSIMEEEQSITVCGSWVSILGDDQFKSPNLPAGLIELPLLALLNGNFVPQSTAMIRRSFIATYGLEYEDYPYAEDYQMWVELAKQGAVFFIESQALVQVRMSELKRTEEINEERRNVYTQLRQQLLAYHIQKTNEHQLVLQLLYDDLQTLRDRELMTTEEIIRLFSSLFLKNKKTLIRD